MTTIVYAAVYAIGWLLLVRQRPAWRAPRLTGWGIWLVVLVVVGWVAQLLHPALLDEGIRDTSAIRAGQWWRLATALVLQDGGWIGAVFNVVALAVTVGLVGEVLTRRIGVLVFAAGGVVANLLVALTFAQPGADSSMATMPLLVVAVVLGTRNPSWRDAGLVALLVVLTVLLLIRRDERGMALALGLLLGVVLRRRRSAAADS